MSSAYALVSFGGWGRREGESPVVLPSTQCWLRPISPCSPPALQMDATPAGSQELPGMRSSPVATIPTTVPGDLCHQQLLGSLLSSGCTRFRHLCSKRCR